MTLPFLLVAVFAYNAGAQPQRRESNSSNHKPAECRFGILEPCEQQCRQGSVDACVTLGRMLAGGQGVAADYSRAYELLSAACTKGHVVGCGALGELYLAGLGVERDVTRGIELLRDSCESGDGLSCESLGGAYSGLHPELAQDLGRDFAAAAEWWDRACDLGVTSACVSLAAALADGAGVPRDPRRAAKLLDQGCDKKVPIACKLLADMYANGEGVQRDESTADALYTRACDLGYQRACKP